MVNFLKTQQVVVFLICAISSLSGVLDLFQGCPGLYQMFHDFRKGVDPLTTTLSCQQTSLECSFKCIVKFVNVKEAAVVQGNFSCYNGEPIYRIEFNNGKGAISKGGASHDNPFFHSSVVNDKDRLVNYRLDTNVKFSKVKTLDGYRNVVHDMNITYENITVVLYS